jgi:hypothetical protein
MRAAGKGSHKGGMVVTGTSIIATTGRGSLAIGSLDAVNPAVSMATATAGRALSLILVIEEPDFTISSTKNPVTKNTVSIFELARFPLSFLSPLEPMQSLRHSRCARGTVGSIAHKCV